MPWLRPIPCQQCKGEYLLGDDGQPECGLGQGCQAFAFVSRVLELRPLPEKEFQALTGYGPGPVYLTSKRIVYVPVKRRPTATTEAFDR